MKDAQFLSLLNQNLIDLEGALDNESDENFVSVFILGLPRSGTTLLSQVLYDSLDLACTNHVVARFWEAPLVGAKLSKVLFEGQKATDFSSQHGRTRSLNEPHEFSWFWHNALKYNDFSSYDPELASAEIDWQLLRNKLIGMTNIFGCGVVHKPLELVAYQLDYFRNLLDKALFVYIEREPIEVAQSIYSAREKNGVDQWFGSYPPKKHYESLAKKSVVEQVAGQVFFLRKLYEEKLALLDEKNIVRITHKELCDDPNQVLEKVITKSAELGSVIGKKKTPKSFNPKSRYDNNIIKTKLEKALLLCSA